MDAFFSAFQMKLHLSVSTQQNLPVTSQPTCTLHFGQNPSVGIMKWWELNTNNSALWTRLFGSDLLCLPKQLPQIFHPRLLKWKHHKKVHANNDPRIWKDEHQQYQYTPRLSTNFQSTSSICYSECFLSLINPRAQQHQRDQLNHN